MTIFEFHVVKNFVVTKWVKFAFWKFFIDDLEKIEVVKFLVPDRIFDTDFLGRSGVVSDVDK